MRKDLEDQRLVFEDEKKAPRIKKSLCKLPKLFVILPFEQVARDEALAEEKNRAKEVMKNRQEDSRYQIVFSGSVKVSIKLLPSDLYSGAVKVPDI